MTTVELETADFGQHYHDVVNKFKSIWTNYRRVATHIGFQNLRDQFTTRNYNRVVDIPEYVIPECLESITEQIKERGIAILKQHSKKLQERLSDIGFLFDRTDKVLLKKGDDIMTISKYEQTLVDQSRHIIESSDIMRPVLNKIKDLDKEVTNDDQFWRD